MAPRSSGGGGKRPWLAGVLCLLATGLGHLYLRRWVRALGWFLLSYAVAVAVVPTETLSTVLDGGVLALETLWPVLVVQAAAAVDAYRIAAVAPVASADGEDEECPHCGKELDSDLEFCPWCSAELRPESEVEPSG
ncbi:MAG: zinc ribbon domain-containing protein [Halolamina sp.]